MEDKVDIQFNKIDISFNDQNSSKKPQVVKSRLVVDKRELPEEKPARKRLAIRRSHLRDEADPLIADQLQRMDKRARLFDSMAFQIVVGVIGAALLAWLIVSHGGSLAEFIVTTPTTN